MLGVQDGSAREVEVLIYGEQQRLNNRAVTVKSRPWWHIIRRWGILCILQMIASDAMHSGRIRTDGGTVVVT